MKKIGIIFALLLVFNLSAQTNNEVSLLTKNEWINTNLDYLRFHNDTVVYNIANNKEELLFDVGKRKLYFKLRYRVAGEIKYETFEFDIKQLQPDKLIIAPATKEEEKIAEFRKLDASPFLKEKQYIFYNRGQLISRVDFKKITFHSSTCFGMCPSISVEVNRDGKVFYKGRTYSDHMGNYAGTLGPKEMLELRKIINRSQLYKLDEKWKQQRSPNDQPRYNYIVELKNGKLIEINTNDQHPILDKLSDFMIGIHEKATLAKADEKHEFETSTLENYRITVN